MALVHVITKGDKIDAKHVNSGTAHSDPSDTLWLDGKATQPRRVTVRRAAWRIDPSCRSG